MSNSNNSTAAQKVSRKTKKAIRMCEINNEPKAYIALSITEMKMLLRLLPSSANYSNIEELPKDDFYYAENREVLDGKLKMILRKRKASDDVPLDTVKRAKTSEDIKMMEAPVENVKTEGMKEDEEAVKNELEYFDRKKGWRMREMAEVPDTQSINREEMEDRDEPMLINFEGTFHEEVKEFNDDEKVLFEYGFMKLKKDFRAIQQQYLPEKTVGEIVGFYYRWKTTGQIYGNFKPSNETKAFAKAAKITNEVNEGRKKRRSSFLKKDLLREMEELATEVMKKKKIEKKVVKISPKKEKEEEVALKEEKTMKSSKGKVRGPYRKRTDSSKKPKEQKKE
ncbi:hypothetical protein PRIPAC_73801 [Pristionchus pacificus]|uniref:SANT domain-containing protein n=1 Tax=Pristionchus pacificus TaxID=54126 RepID=A0A454XR00_PRIPA|nr:hypothetical protein PRIPAC_73801 [Pristionchus pacificus]|eukprot:PDM64971.1 hypothetical protein PRIPAC_53227 [Pristionchus pacificus]